MQALAIHFPQTESMSDIQVVFADNQPLMLSGLRTAVADHTDIRIVDECLDRERALKAVRNHVPNVLLLSAELLHEKVDALQQLVTDIQETHVILLSSRDDPDFVEEALRSGARGVFQRNKPIHFIPQAIRKVTSGGLWFERALAEHMVDRLVSRRNEAQNPEDQKISAVTAREREVIELICKGLKNREVSEQLHISEVTVSHHLTSIFRKLEVSDRISLILYSVRNRMVML